MSDTMNDPTLLDDLAGVHDDLTDILQDILTLSKHNQITFLHNTPEDMYALAQSFSDKLCFNDFKLLIEALMFVSEDKKPIDLTLVVSPGQSA